VGVGYRSRKSGEERGIDKAGGGGGVGCRSKKSGKETHTVGVGRKRKEDRRIGEGRVGTKGKRME
jgi:hypothetical protein